MAKKQGVIFTPSRYKGKRVMIAPTGNSYAYAQGKFWVLREIASDSVIHRGRSLRDIEDYLLEQLRKA